MNVYVAGRTTDLVTVTRIADAIEAEGHEITFKWWGGEGEIRTDLKSEDLELIEEKSISIEEAEGSGWTATVKHNPTGEMGTGNASSKVAAHDQAIMALRAKLNAGWQAKPERARELARREIRAVITADAVVLVWAPDILGAAIETGAAMGLDKKVYVYRPGRDSVFWYLPNVTQVWTLTELLDLMNEHSNTEFFDEDPGPDFIPPEAVKDVYRGGGKMMRRASDHSVSADPTGADRARRTL